MKQRARNAAKNSDATVAFVRAHPGATSEATRSALGISRSTWAYYIKKLVGEGKIRRRGTKRSSTLTAS